MKVPRIVAMLMLLGLGACGGGSGDTEAPVAAQQYVDGIWEGTLGDNESFAIINATPSGTSSDVHVAKKVSVPSYPYGGTSPYDIVQGLLSVRQNRLTGTSFAPIADMARDQPLQCTEWSTHFVGRDPSRCFP
jgi:hypothetical protein